MNIKDKLTEATIKLLTKQLYEDKNITVNDINYINNNHEAQWHGYRVAYLDCLNVLNNENINNKDKINELNKQKDKINIDIKNYINYDLLSSDSLKQSWLKGYKEYILDTINKLELQGKYFIQIEADYSDEYGDVSHRSMIPIIENNHIIGSSNSNNIQFYDSQEQAYKSIKSISDNELLDTIKKYIPGNDNNELLNYNIEVKQHRGFAEHNV